MGAEEVAAEPGQSTDVGDRTSFTWPVELPSGARLLPIVAAPEPPGEASVNLTENAQATSPVNPIGATSEPAADLTGEAETTSPANLTERPESTSPVNLTGAPSERRESKGYLRKRRTRAVRRSTSPVRRKTVEDRARELDELIRSGELAENSSVNRVRLALRCSPENARRAIEWRRAHLTGQVTGEPIGELVDDPTRQVVDAEPHELTIEPALAAAR